MIERILSAWRLFWAVLVHGREFVPTEALQAAQKQIAELKTKAREKVPDRFGEGAVYALVLLQREGRLVDFLKEDISPYPDADVGRAVREIHAGCVRVLEENFHLTPVVDKAEGEIMEVAAGFDPGEIKLTGAVPDAPPYKGHLRHKGWQAGKLHFPERTGKGNEKIIQAAEVEIG